ncbi:MAG TPA: hypothetical protein VGF48_03930 [Thermoanaerobaculia bacterium]|jgi:hypothetical protein
MSRLLAVVLVLCAVVPAFGQVVVLPAAPSPNHFVRLSVTGPSCPGVTRAVRNGAFLDIESDTPPFCIATPPTVTTVLNAGYLPHGTYTIRFVDTSAPPARTIVEANAGTFTVTMESHWIRPTPPAPTSTDFVSVAVHLPSCIPVAGATRNGSFIDLRLTPREVCLGAEPIVITTLGIGYLPADTYTFRVFNVNDPSAPVLEDADAGSLVVAESHGPAHVPTLDFGGMAALIMAISIAAFIAIRRAAL